MRNAILVFFAVLLLFSCVPNRKILFLQKKGELDKKAQANDTTVRDYTIEDFSYKVQTHDIISVRYQSLTAKQFDFLEGQAQQNISANLGAIGGALLIGDLVDERGEIPVPVVGKIKVAGLTVFQIQDTLQLLANRYLEGPIVKVRLLNYRITILGEVNKESAITLGNNRVSIMEAIGLAGGLTDLADRSSIKVIRQTNTKAEVHYVNLLEEDFMKSPYYYVRQNDLIIVPPLRQRPFRKYFSQNLSLFLSAVSVVLLVVTLTRK